MTVVQPVDAMSAEETRLADISTDSIIVFGPTGQIHYWNPAAESLFGWPAIAVVGRSISDLSLAADEDPAWRQLLQEGSWQGTIRRRNPRGENVEASVRRFVRFQDDGSVRDIAEVGRGSLGLSAAGTDAVGDDPGMAASWQIDISACNPLIEIISREGRTALPDVVGGWYHDLLREARIIDVNDRAMRLVGGNRGRGRMIGQPVADFWPAGNRKALAEMIVAAANHAERDRASTRQLASDGILRDPVLSVWRSGSGEQADHIFATMNGTADDDRTYPFLMASEARYRKLMHFMPIALWQVDASGMGKLYADLKSKGVADFERYLEDHPNLVEFAAATVPVTDVNRSAVQMMGGASVQDLIQPLGYLFEESPDSLRRVMIGRFSGRKNYSEFMKIRTLDGRVLDVRFSVTYPEPSHELDTTIFSLEDMTDRLRMEAQLRQLEADFSHAARISMLGELTSSIAHEVNQPLAAIMTNAETSLRWLARPVPDFAKVRQLTERIAGSAQRADDIVRRIRGMAAKQQPEQVALNLNEVVQESLLFVRHEVDSRSIRVTASYTRGLEPVTGDRVQLQQVIVNLLINAFQAVESQEVANRKILLATGIEEDNSVYFSLRDSGSGIPAENLAQIFHGFFTTKENGLGIGLAICHSIVAAHGGSIVAANRPEGGAEFRVTLPCSVPAALLSQ